MLSFTPKFHTQITTGEEAGSWVASLLPMMVFNMNPPAMEIANEAQRIQSEGGTVLSIDAKADHDAPQAAPAAGAPEVDLFEVFAARVRGGKPLYISGQLDEVQGKLHVALVNRLREETGLPVHVIHH